MVDFIIYICAIIIVLNICKLLEKKYFYKIKSGLLRFLIDILIAVAMGVLIIFILKLITGKI